MLIRRCRDCLPFQCAREPRRLRPALHRPGDDFGFAARRRAGRLLHLAGAYLNDRHRTARQHTYSYPQRASRACTLAAARHLCDGDRRRVALAETGQRLFDLDGAAKLLAAVAHVLVAAGLRGDEEHAEDLYFGHAYISGDEAYVGKRHVDSNDNHYGAPRAGRGAGPVVISPRSASASGSASECGLLITYPNRCEGRHGGSRQKTPTS